MGTWIKRRKITFETRYEWRFYYQREDWSDSFFAFDCDKDGKLTFEGCNNPEETQRRFDDMTAFKKDDQGNHLKPRYMTSWEEKVVDPGRFKCDCGKVIEGPYSANDFSCSCGAEYNCSGQRLADRYHWGEETGETFTYPNWKSHPDGVEESWGEYTISVTPREALNLVRVDLDMLQSGEWVPDDDSIEAMRDMLLIVESGMMPDTDKVEEKQAKYNVNDFDVIDVDFYNQHQTWHYSYIRRYYGIAREGSFKASPVVVKVVIKRNAYDSQSSMKGFVYNADSGAWNQLVYKPITEARCKAVSYADKSPDRSLFSQDAALIVSKLLEILK